MSEQPEALRLAGWLQANYEADGVDEAAAELRRLHALCDELGRALEATRMPLDLYNAYGWPDRERGAVPEGYVAVPRFLAENHRNLTDVPRYQRILDDCLAAAHDQFRDATKMIGNCVLSRFAGIHCPLDRGLEVLPARVAQRCLQIACEPELDAFGVGALDRVLQVVLQSFQLLVHEGLCLSRGVIGHPTGYAKSIHLRRWS